MKTIVIKDAAGTFAENKDVARKLRVEIIMPALEQNEEVIIDFEGVTGATQSFVHALISDAIRKYGNEALEKISYKDCSPVVREIVITVTEYMQES
ncbi:MAG TPA: STAS-like domain-containing protein [Candidatus Saccharimonadales bacterium]|jgi:hypothetical protein